VNAKRDAIQRGVALSCLLVANLASAIFSGDGAAAEIHTYRSDDGRFSIDFPAPSPSAHAMTGAQFLFTDNDARHAVNVGDVEYAVEIHDVPRVAYGLLSSHFILENAKSGMLDDIGAREIDSREIDRQGKPGRVVAFEIPEIGVTGNLLIVLAKNRLYLVTVRHLKEDDPPVPFTAFIESFEFWFE
jgi:hypothetical protein